MRTLIRVWMIATLFVASAAAQKVFVAGTKTVAECEYAVHPLVADLNAIGFPSNWMVVVACTPAIWDYLRAKADARGTQTAFTNLAGRVTVVNAAIYLQPLPLRGTAHRTPRGVLQHERGHILCGCGDEWKADRFVVDDMASEIAATLGPRVATQRP
jgi:hypothetical protein